MENKQNLPVKIKSISPYNLTGIINTNTTDKINKHIETTRCQDKLYELMMKNDEATVKELNGFANMAVKCLAKDKIFPPAADVMKREKIPVEDIKQAQDDITRIINSENTVLKKALIWFCLRVSLSFIHRFCPPPNPHLRRSFLINPEKFHRYVIGTNPNTNYLVSHLSMFIQFDQPVEQFVTNCCVDWFSLAPWKDHEVWSNIDTNMPSAEHNPKKRIKYSENDLFGHNLLDAGGGRGDDVDDYY